MARRPCPSLHKSLPLPLDEAKNELLPMNAWSRYAIQLALATGGAALLLAIPDQVARQVTVSVLAAVCMLLWLAELSLILALHIGLVPMRWGPTSPLSIVLLIFLTFAATTLPHLALALSSRPEQYYTALQPVGNVYSRWLRMALMQIMLIGQGGYMRYIPVSLVSQSLSAAVITLAFLGKAVVLAMIVRLVLSGARKARATARRIVSSPPLVRHRFVVYNVALFLLSLPLVATMGAADGNRPAAPRVLFAVLAVVANLVAVLEAALSMHRLFSRDHVHERPLVPRIAAQLLFYAQASWAALMTTVLFDSPRAWTLVLNDIGNGFALWWRMLFVTVVALGPGGVSLIIPRRVWIECVLAGVTALWLLVLVLLLNVAISMTGVGSNEKKQKDDDDDPLVFNTQ